MRFIEDFVVMVFVYSVAFVFGFIIKETITIIGVLLALLMIMLSLEYLLKRKKKPLTRT